MAFGGGLEDQEDVLNEINMTPLVDVMLVLLIIFIVTMPVLTHSLPLDLPRSEAAPSAQQEEGITLSITADGSLFWNGSPIDPATMEARLRAAASRQPQPEVNIRGDRKVAYERVIEVMATVQRSGLSKLGFLTDPEP